MERVKIRVTVEGSRDDPIRVASYSLGADGRARAVSATLFDDFAGLESTLEASLDADFPDNTGTP